MQLTPCSSPAIQHADIGSPRKDVLSGCAMAPEDFRAQGLVPRHGGWRVIGTVTPRGARPLWAGLPLSHGFPFWRCTDTVSRLRNSNMRSSCDLAPLVRIRTTEPLRRSRSSAVRCLPVIITTGTLCYAAFLRSMSRNSESSISGIIMSSVTASG